MTRPEKNALWAEAKTRVNDDNFPGLLHEAIAWGREGSGIPIATSSKGKEKGPDDLEFDSENFREDSSSSVILPVKVEGLQEEGLTPYRMFSVALLQAAFLKEIVEWKKAEIKEKLLGIKAQKEEEERTLHTRQCEERDLNTISRTLRTHQNTFVDKLSAPDTHSEDSSSSTGTSPVSPEDGPLKDIIKGHVKDTLSPMITVDSATSASSRTTSFNSDELVDGITILSPSFFNKKRRPDVAKFQKEQIAPRLANIQKEKKVAQSTINSLESAIEALRKELAKYENCYAETIEKQFSPIQEWASDVQPTETSENTPQMTSSSSSSSSPSLSSPLEKKAEMTRFIMSNCTQLSPFNIDEFGNTLLAWAVQTRNKPAVELLVRLGADPFTKNREGKSAVNFSIDLPSETGPSINDVIKRWIAAPVADYSEDNPGSTERQNKRWNQFLGEIKVPSSSFREDIGKILLDREAYWEQFVGFFSKKPRKEVYPEAYQQEKEWINLGFDYLSLAFFTNDDEPLTTFISHLPANLASNPFVKALKGRLARVNMGETKYARITYQHQQALEQILQQTEQQKRETEMRLYEASRTEEGQAQEELIKTKDTLALVAAERETLATQVEKLTQQIATLQTDITQYQADLKRQATEATEHAREVAAVQAEVQEEKKENAQLKEKIETIEGTQKTLEKQMTANIQSADERERELQETLERKEAEAVRLLKEKEDLTQANQGLKEKLSRLEAEKLQETFKNLDPISSTSSASTDVSETPGDDDDATNPPAPPSGRPSKETEETDDDTHVVEEETPGADNTPPAPPSSGRPSKETDDEKTDDDTDEKKDIIPPADVVEKETPGADDDTVAKKKDDKVAQIPSAAASSSSFFGGGREGKRRGISPQKGGKRGGNTPRGK